MAALETNMSPLGFFKQLAESQDESALLSQLSGTLLGDHLSQEKDLSQAENTVKGFYHNLMRHIGSKSPSPLVTDFVEAQAGLRAFKNYLKREHLKLDVSTPDSAYDEGLWETVWAGLPTALHPAFESLATECRSRQEEMFKNPTFFDATFDSLSLKAQRDMVSGLENDFIAEHMRRVDSAKGLELLWRARNADMPDEVRRVFVENRQESDFFHELANLETNEWPELIMSRLEGIHAAELSKLEGTEQIRHFVNAADNWIIEHLRGALNVPFGPERIFGCLKGLEIEAYNMTLCVVGRANKVKSDVLQRCLKACYV
jgi:vacuolar-type H+-ATPase subunit C/Vma6